MAYKEIKIVEKYEGTPASIVVSPRRIGTPTIIQPTYTFDVSDMYGIFIPEVSLNDNYFKWTGGLLEPSVLDISYLRDLKDVSVTALVNNEVLAYDTSISMWKGKTIFDTSLYDVVNANDYFWIFADVSLVNPVGKDQVLAYDTSINKFKNMTINASFYTLEDAGKYFYTKGEVDSLIYIITGGVY